MTKDKNARFDSAGLRGASKEAARETRRLAKAFDSLPSPVSVPEGDAREIAREIADLACGPFPTGGPAAKHREKIADRITAALLSAESRGERKMREGAAQRIEACMPATQDMRSTEICDALENAAEAIRSLSSPEEG